MLYPLSPTLFNHYSSKIAALPPHTPLSPSDLLTPQFLVAQTGRIAIYYIPFEVVNPAAKVMIVGITPGWTQMELAYRVARDNLKSGLPSFEVLRKVKATASFAGSIRGNLVQMLDGIGLHEALGISSSLLLFEQHFDMFYPTSVIRFPVFVNGKGYTGSSPGITKTPLFHPYIYGRLSEEVRLVKDALVIPLGDSATAVMQLLINRGVLASERCLVGFPHPSGANGWRKIRYEQNRDDLHMKVQYWFKKQR